MAYLVLPDGSLVEDSTSGVLPSGDLFLASGAGNSPPTFSGPSIGAQSGTVGAAVSNSVASKFTDSDALTFTGLGSWPPGLSVTSAGVITGTPTTAGTYTGLSVRATDTAAQTADSDTFTYTISGGSGGLTISNTLANVTFSGSFGTSSTGTLTSQPLRDNAGNILSGVALTYVAVYNDTTNALVVKKTGISTNGSGIFTVTDAAISVGQTYRLDWEDGAGRRRMPRATAS